MLGRAGLTHCDKALELLLDAIRPIRVKSKTVALLDALDQICARDLVSPQNLPEWPKSVMDGYAVKARDTYGASPSTPAYLTLTGEVLMGEAPQGKVEKGCAHKIPTGGLLPEGTDAVVMYENTIAVDDSMIEVVKDTGVGTAVCQAGEDIKTGSSLVEAGKKLTPYDLGLLAGLGIDRVDIVPKPRVAILSTGDEVIPCSETPQKGKIRDINSITLAAMVKRNGGIPDILGIFSDNTGEFYPALQKAADEYDVVLFSGGSSVGVKDIGEKAIQKLGNPGILVHGVALKPGKPLIIGLHKNTPVFGLPGHPVSALVCFNQFVIPLLGTLAGRKTAINEKKASVFATLTRNINSAPGRRDFIRVTLAEKEHVLTATPVLGKSSSISSMSKAHGYFVIDEDSQGAAENTQIEVILYQ